MDNNNWIDARELFGDSPLMAEIVAGFIELDDDGQKLILDLVDLLNRRHESNTH